MNTSALAPETAEKKSTFFGSLICQLQSHNEELSKAIINFDKTLVVLRGPEPTEPNQPDEKSQPPDSMIRKIDRSLQTSVMLTERIHIMIEQLQNFI